MKNIDNKKTRKKIKLIKKTNKERRRILSLKKKQIQIPNIIFADKILKGAVNAGDLKKVQDKKFLYENLGKYNSDITVEKFVLKTLREHKKQRLRKVKPEERTIFKFKKEPEKNKTHWDHLIEEMKWMNNDFEKERKLKKKFACDLSKLCKKSLETRHLEVEKTIKRQELELKKKCLIISRSVNNYWKKIEKITKHHYNILLQENKVLQQQNRLLAFINKLQKISTRVADSLPSGKIVIDELPTNTEEISIILKKNEDNTYSIIDNNIDENIVAKVAQCAEQFQPKGINLSQVKIDTSTPFLLKGELREYQLIGLHWLTALHDNKINGILADEMGLGKTIQTISLIAHLAGNKGIWGPHLIVVPTTIIINWEIEFKKWCPSLKILSYYGNQKERKAKRYGWQKPNAFNVCITSYKLVIQDYSVFKRKRWYYIILDEAQNIKNFKSKRWQMLLNFKAKRKLLLTGTPLQNDIMEIWSYMHFLMPNLFYSNEEFRDWFHSQFYNAIHNNASLNKKLIQSLHSILRPFLLRRLKKDVEKQLPEKIEHVIYCELTRRQRFLYDEFINSDKTQDTLKKSDYFSIMNILMQLRKVCNHPDLFETRDYITPSVQLFDLDIMIPYLVLSIFSYDPLSSINLKNLNLILEENDKMSKYDYIQMINKFPVQPFFEIYNDIMNKEKSLYTPRYLIDENDILFKRQYADSTILAEENTEEIRFLLDKTLQSYNYAHNLPFPKHVCPTNIPLLQHTSLTSYFDIMHEIDTTNLKEPQDYLQSIFNENISKLRKIKHSDRLRILHNYDLLSRKNLVYNSPIYGCDLLHKIKVHRNIDTAHTKQIIYGKEIFADNLTGNLLLNKSFRFYIKNGLYNKSFEGLYDYSIINTEKEKNEDVIIDNQISPEPLKLYKTYSNAEYIHKINDNFEEIKNENINTINFINTDSINSLIMTPNKILHLCEDLMNNFRIHIPKVISKGPRLRPSSFKTEFYQTVNKYRLLYNNLNRIPNVQKYFSLFKIISFPDKNLVEFDSGKLIKLAGLLKKLKLKKSKALIFTQMTRMLDILEIFLNLHGYTYVRLDGSTKVETRQNIVDRFNNDLKIFCFISSTRSGGIGLNLTGADSIIFYDTDWNPAMDKQAQDRCHRIGQTRTVHIYRLITLSTIEENIFKKSIQKRELNYVIMEDGRFDTDNFTKINFKNIIQEENLIKDDQVKKLLEFENLQFENEEDQKNLEQLLIKIEDQEDVQALKNVSREILDEYEQENNEQIFINRDEERDGGDILKDKKLTGSLKNIDLFAIKNFKNSFTFEDFIKEKESKSLNFTYALSEESDISLNEELQISDEEDKISKLDLDKAYEMYLSKKQEIMKNYQLHQEEKMSDDI